MRRPTWLHAALLVSVLALVAAPRAARAEAPAPDPSFDEAVRVLFAERSEREDVGTACPGRLADEARVGCAIDLRYRDDPASGALAHRLYERWRVVAGVEPAHRMNGGYRGVIQLEPALPVRSARHHLAWIVAALTDFDALFARLGGRGRVAYRHQTIALRFMRSIGKRTPSAVARAEGGWTVAWNLDGSLHRSEEAVRETLFHEIFHLNDFTHGAASGGAWSSAALSGVFDAVVKRCGTDAACLAPFAPNHTKVRGGTYYAFQPGNGVHEYAAELAIRYYREQRAALRGDAGRAPAAFKCGPAENARAWALLRDEFFGGVDLTPPCGRAR